MSRTMSTSGEDTSGARTLARASTAAASSASLLPIVVVLVGSLWAVWLSVRTGQETTRFAGVDLPILGVALQLAVAFVVLGLLLEGLAFKRWPLSAPAVGGVFVLVVTVSLLLLEEMAASLIPTSFLPTSVRRLAIDVYGGVGAWVAALASLLLVVGCRTDGGGAGLARSVWNLLRHLPGKLLVMVGAAGTAVGIAAWSRYQPWASGAAAGERIDVPGWSLPVIGPTSLVAVLVLGASTVGLLVRRNLLTALLLVLAGWACSFLAAVGLLTASSLARVEVDQLLPDAVAGYGPSVDPRWGAWVMFAMGCLISGSGIGIIAWVEADER